MRAVWLLPTFASRHRGGVRGGEAPAGCCREQRGAARNASDATSDGWGDLAERAEFGCGEAIRVMRASMSEGRSTPREEKAFGFITKGDEAALIKECGTALGPGLGRCTEYTPGSENAIDCARTVHDRRAERLHAGEVSAGDRRSAFTSR